MCRGEMLRYIIKNRIENPEDLRAFTWEGFAYDEGRSTDEHLQVTLVLSAEVAFFAKAPYIVRS
mgnify:CR=1 FL=1